MKAVARLNPDYLRACAIIAAKNDIRWYLCGVKVEIGPQHTRYVACDGHKLIVIRDTRSKEAPQEPCNVLIPRETIATVSKVKAAGVVVGVELHYDTEATGAECRLGNVCFKPMEGKFPEYSKVIPKEVSGERGQYNANYMLDFQRAATTAFGSHCIAELWQNGQAAALVLVGGVEDFVGVVMPIREASSGKAPAWVIPPEEPKAEPAVAANTEPAAAAA